MKFQFETTKINKRLYKRAIRYYIYQAVGNAREWNKYKDVTVKLKPMSMASEDRFFNRDGKMEFLK